MILAQTSDPYANYFEVDASQKPKKLPVPEPAEWGLIFVGCVLLLVLWVKLTRPRDRA